MSKLRFQFTTLKEDNEQNEKLSMTVKTRFHIIFFVAIQDFVKHTVNILMKCELRI